MNHADVIHSSFIVRARQSLAALRVVTALALLTGVSPLQGEHQVVVGSATTINKFHDLTYHHVALAVPIERTTRWQPTAWTFGVGAFNRDGDAATVYSVGPTWLWDSTVTACRCFINAGISLVYLEQREFHDHVKLRWEDFGKDVQFMTRLSLGWYLDSNRNWSMEASIMHVSNGGLDEVNPGADFVGVDLQFGY